MKLVALDVGTKRIGVAKADTAVKIAIPSGAIEADGTEIGQIVSFARVYGTNFFIVGLPRNSKGEETAQSAYSRDFAKRLKRAMPEARICFQDESLTSVEAEERLDKRKKKYRKGDIDAEAATIILQDFLEAHAAKINSVNDAEKKIEKKATSETIPVKHHPIRNLLLSLFALLVVAGVGGYVFYRINLLPVITDLDCSSEQSPLPQGCEKITFVVKNGEGSTQIANNLADAGLIRNSLVFQIQYRLFYASKSLQAGTYNFDKTMNMDSIISAIVDGAADNVFSLTVVPGNTIMDVKAKLMEQGYDADAIDIAFHANYNHPVLADKPEGASLEGYLFSETYEFFRDESLEKIVVTMLDTLYQAVTENDLIAAYAEHGLNLYQGITLASIVQQEAKNDDMPGVAQVFYNRLSAGMTLGSDVTIQYALDLADPNREVYTNNESALAIDSPYNTRLYAGLPYGPISNPSLNALLAVAHPVDHAYLYFLTGDDGLVYYSSTDSEHQQNIIDHCQELCSLSL